MAKLPLTEIIADLPIFEGDLSVEITGSLKLDMPIVNLIIREIENRRYHHK